MMYDITTHGRDDTRACGLNTIVDWKSEGYRLEKCSGGGLMGDDLDRQSIACWEKKALQSTALPLS
jgi:hypothetical protein